MFISWSVLWKGCFTVFKVKVTVKVLNFRKCLPGQYLWSVKLSMVMHHHQPEYHSEISFFYVQGQIKPQSFLLDPQKYWNFCNPNQFDGTSSQDRVRHREKILLLLHKAWDREYGLGDCGLDCCHSCLSRYLKQGSVPVPIKKMWKEHCFCNEYTCLLSFFVNCSSVWLLYPFVLAMVST